MKVNNTLQDMYSNYYGSSEDLASKRSISAKDTVINIISLFGQNNLGNLIDVGAGNGSVINELASRSLYSSVSALEISATGIEEIKSKNFPNIREVKKFDGYAIPYKDNQFDTALCIHVLEHVEHERLFLQELSRIASRVYIEVPLEGGIRVRINRKYGHINYYTPPYMLNLLETSGFRIISSNVFTSSKAYEIHCSGVIIGTVKHIIRYAFLKILGKNLAPNFTTYFMGIVCEKN